MHRTLVAAVVRPALALLVLLAAGSWTPSALADSRAERDALALRQRAIEDDNLNVNYAAAVKKLRAGLTRCGATGCRAAVRAGLLRDLGAMQILNGNVDDGRASFKRALGLLATIELDDAYKNPMLESIWRDVKSGAAGADTGEQPKPPPAADFSHVPAAEAQVLTPLALYLEYTGSEPIAKAIAKYHASQMDEWKSTLLRRVGRGYGALLPCRDMLEGSVQYYVVGFNAEDEPVATAGSRNQPFTVAINAHASGPIAALPGEPPPAPCEAAALAAPPDECPPNFPGCSTSKAADASLKGAGEECGAGDECDSGRCDDGKCVGSGASRVRAFKRVWLGLSVQADVYFMPSADTACTLASPGVLANSVGYFCVDGANHAFPPATGSAALAMMANLSIPPRQDQVTGGPALGNVRLLASVDYGLNPNVLLGVRAGYIFNTNPATTGIGVAFQAFHGEARFTYLFGKDALANTFAPLVLASTGIGEFDGQIPLTLNLVRTTAAPAQSLPVHAWVTSGPFFVAAGPGLRLTFANWVALSVAAKFEVAFGGSAGTLSGVAPELGLAFGL